MRFKHQKAGRCVILLGILAGLLLTVSAARPTAESDARPLIFVAGNPNLYPIEYYDAANGTFCGVIPSLLEDFSAASGYRVEYLDTGSADARERKLKNKQAELISGCTDTDDFLSDAGNRAVTVLSSESGGERKDYRILFSDTADETLQASLNAFLAGVPESRRTALLLAAVRQHQTPALLYALLAVGVVALVLLITVIVLARKQRKLARAARQSRDTDEMTGIGNREYLVRYYRQILTDTNRVLYASLWFAIDTPKLRRLVSPDKLEDFLRYIAVELNEQITQNDILSRVGDGGFAVLKQYASKDELRRWLETVGEKLREYGKRDGTSVPYEVFAGLYFLKQTDRDLDAILYNAEQSAVYAKEHGLVYAECTNEILNVCKQEAELLDGFERALSKQEFVVYLHFFVAPSNRAILGAEALSRWNHPERGLLNPAAYIGLLERENRIEQLDFYMLDCVCAILAAWKKEKQGDFFISCNFSRDTFIRTDFTERCIAVIEKYDFPREELILELTESGTMDKAEMLYRNAARMKEYGVSLALDDFGNGHSDFFDLEKYRFDALKLDKRLIDNLNTAEGEIILGGIVDIGHRLGMTILAEGAETGEQAARLGALKCDVIQGFCFYQPLPLAEAKRVLTENRSRLKPEEVM